MIIKFYKRIHNKHFNVLKSLYFIWYVLGIFLVAIAFFFSIPKFFNYEKKQEIIRYFLMDKYNLELKNFKTVKYNILPLPNLLLTNVNFKIKDEPIFLKSEKVNIFLNLKNIYDFSELKSQKIIIKENDISLDIIKTKNLFNYFKKLKASLKVKSLNLLFTKSSESIFKVKNINFSNYGHQKSKIDGELFGNEFRISLNNRNQDLNFILKNTGIKAYFKFNDTNLIDSINGSSELTLLNNLLKYDFVLFEDKLEIINLNFRNKKISFFSNALIKFNPFFDFDLRVNVKEFDKNIINVFNLENLEKYKTVLKKLNGKIVLDYKNKKYFSGLVDLNSSVINFAYGRLKFSNQTKIAGAKINCLGESSLTEEFPRLNFICEINTQDKKKFLKKFSLSDKDKKSLDLKVEGSINLLRKKINFEKISGLNNYRANDEDLNFFKEKFENKLFSDNIFGMFDKEKIKFFLLEII